MDTQSASTSYVKERITEALITLMKEYPFEKITVTQIVQIAVVGRASFYRNYKDKEDIVRQYLTKLIKEWGKAFEALGPTHFQDSLLNHFYINRDFYQLLYQSGLSNMLYDNIRVACGATAEDDNISAYCKAMIAGWIFGWIDEWIRRGMKETPEEMIRIADERKKAEQNKKAN